MKNKKISLALLVTSFAFIAYGAYRGEADTVLMKAINVCVECIGIG